MLSEGDNERGCAVSEVRLNFSPWMFSQSPPPPFSFPFLSFLPPSWSSQVGVSVERLLGRKNGMVEVFQKNT